MMIDDKKIEQMMQKEIEKQVKKKLEHLNVYELQDEVVRKVMWDQVSSWMGKNREEIVRALDSHVSIYKKEWEQDIKQGVVDELISRMKDVL